MDLRALKSHLDSLGSPLVLRGGDTALGPLAQVVASMPGGSITLDISQTPVRVDGDTLTVEGTTTATWPIQGMGTAVLRPTSATLTVTSADATTAAVVATLPLSPSAAPVVTVAPGEQAHSWTLSLPATTTGVTPTELIALGLGESLPFDVPTGLDVFSRIATVDPAAFRLTFAPNNQAASAYLSFLAQVSSGTWHLIPDVVDFTGLDVAAVITTGAWSVTLIGHLSVGGIAMALAIQVGSGTVWTASLVPDRDTAFPGIVELANWFSGGTTLGPRTKSGFGALELDPSAFDLALAGVQLSFDTASRTVDQLQIKSLLTVIGLQLDLVLTLPAITLAGSLHTPGTSVVAMLSAAGISTDSVPSGLTITTASFTADAGAGSYSADVVVDGVWPTGPVQLEQIAANVAYSADAWTGTFAARLGIAGTDLELAATYDAGWTFAGRTLPGSSASIGQLIKDLSSKFGIDTVPAALTSLGLTELHVSYAAATGTFDFGCTCTLDVEGVNVTLVATINVTTTAPDDKGDPSVVVGRRGYSARFGGSITLDNLHFDLVFDLAADKADIFVADYVPESDPGPTELKALVAALSQTLAGGVPTGITIDLAEVKFCFYQQTIDKVVEATSTTTTRWAFGLRLGTTIDLSKLPVIGSHLPPDLSLGIEDLEALYANATFTATQITAVNAVLPDKITKLPDPLTAGIGLQGTLRLGSETLPIGTGVQATTPSTAVPAGEPGTELAVRAKAAPPATASTDPITWVDVNKQFGIFSFRRVGVGYADNVLLFSLDASVALGPLAFSMEALTVGSPLDHFHPTFSLSGLSLSFDRPPISLGGAFLRVEQSENGKTFTAYYGQVLIKIPQFSLSAVGGWAPDADPAMFFIYVAVDAPIGGPPFLQITGLAGGFGINSRLVLPDVDHVSGYPLLPGPRTPKQPSDPAAVLTDVLPALKATFEPMAGQYWVAAGIAASSFEMIDVQAVVSVGFGVDVQIGVVGTGSITLPTGDPNPVAYIEIDVVASYTPSSGVLSIIGKLSPASYLFGGFVKLTGGFALCAWFKDLPAEDSDEGVAAGDFVLTVGGYHPAFDKPANYPVVPRLGIAFTLGPIKVAGQAYVALTPGAFMAGIALLATFEAGPISAWFSAGLDFLIAWAPFHYQAHAWVAIGCKIDLGLFSIRVQIGADLQLWGPPFGGQAVVDLDVVSFTIAFGAQAQQPAPVGWATMANNFLPKSPSELPPLAALTHGVHAADDPGSVSGLVSAAVTQGLISTTTPGMDWIVDADHFRVAVRATVPANHPRIGTGVDTGADLPNLVSAYSREVSPVLSAQHPVPTGGSEESSADEPLTGPLPSDLRLALDPTTRTLSDTVVWQTDLDIAPMKQSGVSSFLTVTLLQRSDGGGWTTSITDLTILPQLTSANAALWGDGTATTDANGQRLVPHALVGLDLTPVPRHPGSVNDIALLELIFADGISTGFVYQGRPQPSTYTVHGTVTVEPDDTRILEITVSGAHTADLQETGYVLSALVEDWIGQQRTAVLDELQRLDFATPASSAVDVSELAAAQLSDWPAVALVGQPS